MFKVITMSDSNYFEIGKLLLKTRNKVNADFVLYGPDLSKGQINVLKEHNIEYIKVDENLYKTQMQFLKLGLVIDQIKLDVDKKYKGFTLVDFDTFFINNWSHIFEYDFDYGVTVRDDMIKKKCLRAYANGGVTFAKHSAYDLLNFAKKTVIDGKSNILPEYDQIWKTLETGRPKNKTHYRTTLRWWVDQVFFSALILRYFNEYGYHKIGFKPTIFKFNKSKIALFSCNYYNVLESNPRITKEKNIYIRHLKTTGRKILGINKTQEKLMEK